jgi:hypothetical protein
MRFYHGAHSRKAVGEIRKARRTDGWFPKPIEDAMEEGRPHGVPSRLSSYFLVDDPDVIETAGGSTDYVYLVEPQGTYSKHHSGWMDNVYDAMIPFLRHGDQEEKDAAAPKLVHIAEWVHNYWEGVPYRHRPGQAKTVWEYLAPEILIVEELSAPFGV